MGKRIGLEVIKLRYVIIGNSAAGISAAESIRDSGGAGQVIIISDETYPAYSRVLLTYYVAGLIPYDKIFLFSYESYRYLNADFIPGRRVVGLRPAVREVLLDDGTSVGYDKLLIASGARPVLPRLPGTEVSGVYTLRTLDDALALRERAEKAEEAIVVGGGFVGVKAAWALRVLGLRVRILVSSDQLLSQALDRQAAFMVEERLRENGIEVVHRTDVAAVLEEQGEAVGVLTTSGRRYPGQIVLFGKGVRPNISFLEGSGIRIDKGILVDETMQTNILDIYAAGDVAQAYDCARNEAVVNAIWPNAVAQGFVAGANMVGRYTRYNGGVSMNALEVFGLAVISIGLSQLDSEPSETLVEVDRQKKQYSKVVKRNGRVVGAIFVGDVRSAGLAYQLIKNGQDVPAALREKLPCRWGYADLLASVLT